MASYIVMHNLYIPLLILLTYSLNLTSSREIPPLNITITNSSIHTIQQRLKLAGETPGTSSIDCWASMFELQSCTGEVIQFFGDGETYLGPGCCQAIRVIEHHCWPDMMTTLGFTTDEGDVLQGYCDSEAAP